MDDENPNKINEPENMKEIVNDFVGNDNNYENQNVFINLDSNYNANPDDVKMIGLRKKKKEKKRRIHIDLVGKKRLRNEKSSDQTLLDKIAKLDENSTVSDVISQAKNMGLEVTKQKANLLLEISKAKAVVKKIGIPSNLCKKNMKFYLNAKLQDVVKGLNDDKLVWDTIIGYQFSANNELKGKPYSDMLSYALKVKDFSFVTDKLFNAEEIYSCYCQDKDPNICLIYNPNVVLDEKKIIEMLNNNNSVITGRISTSVVCSYFNSTNLMMCYNVSKDKEGLVGLVASKKIKCVNSKNKMTEGIKVVKGDKSFGVYLNIHNIKPTEFVPSCVFFPGVKEYRCYIDCDIDNNSFYNGFPLKAKTFYSIELPPNCVNFDNLGSFVEMITLIRVCEEKDIDKSLATEIGYIFDMYSKYKPAFNAWRTVYKQFVSIILGYYDSITTKITIDAIIKLRDKINDFITNYNTLKSPGNYYNEVIQLLSLIQKFSVMIKNFVVTNAPINAVESINKVIRIISEGKTIPGTEIEMYFRTAGVICLECLANGTYPMIPEIRSKSAFLGSVGGGKLTNENLVENIIELNQLFTERIEGKKKNQKEQINAFRKAEEIIDHVVENTARAYRNGLYRNNIDLIKRLLKSDPVASKAMLETVLSWMYSIGYDESEVKSKFNFLSDPNVFALLLAVDNLSSQVSNHGVKNANLSDMLGAFRIKKGVATPSPEYEKNAQNLQLLPDKNYYEQVEVEVDKSKFVNSIPGLNDKSRENLHNALAKYNPVKNSVE